MEAQRFYRDKEEKLAVAQRAHKKQRVKAIHAKIAVRRKYALHKLSTQLVQEYGGNHHWQRECVRPGEGPDGEICPGRGLERVQNHAVVQVRLAGVWFEEVKDAYSTQTCSVCGARSGPTGLKGLGIRGLTCGDCGTEHDRDINAAKNILAAGSGRLEGGTPSCRGSGILAL